MAESEPARLEPHKAFMLGRRECIIGQPGSGQRTADDDCPVGSAGGEQEERLAARVREGPGHAGVRLLEAGVAGLEPPVLAARELEQRERVPGGVPDGALEPVGREPPLVEQLAGLVGGQRRRAQRRKIGVASRARRDQERHRVCGDPPGRERDRLGRGGIEPVGVVDQCQHGLLPGGGAEQVERADQHGQPVDRLRRPDRERASERLGLPPGQVGREVGERREQVDQADERHRRLGLDAAGAHDPHVSAVRRRMLEQRRLPDAGLSRDDERAAVARARVVEQAVDTQALLPPAHQHARECTDCRNLPESARDRGSPDATARLPS